MCACLLLLVFVGLLAKPVEMLTSVRATSQRVRTIGKPLDGDC